MTTEPSLENDFSAQLQALVMEAEQSRKPRRAVPASAPAEVPPTAIPAPEPAIEFTRIEAPRETPRPEAPRHEPPAPVAAPEPAPAQPRGTKEQERFDKLVTDLSELFTPVVASIDNVAAAQDAQTQKLERICGAIISAEAIPKALADAKVAFDSRQVVSKAMFEALHAELKSYKDGFLLDAMIRPLIRDVISLYDDTCEIHRHLQATLNCAQEALMEGPAIPLVESAHNATTSLDHHTHFILEVLERLDVTPMSNDFAKLDKQMQRAVSIEAAISPDEDQEIVRVVKRGFMWKDRVIRPEEVVIKRWKESARPADQISEPVEGTEPAIQTQDT